MCRRWRRCSSDATHRTGLKAAGNRVITVLAGRSKELIILEKEMRESSDEVIIMTDDGSYGRKGLVTEGVEEVIKREKVNKCFAIYQLS